MAEIIVYTSAAYNYIPKARALFRSLRKHHPDWELRLLLADRFRPDLALHNEPFDAVSVAAELNIPDFLGWSFCHSIVEFATAIKPFMLRQLLNQGSYRHVFYIDPDVVVFSPLDDIVEALERASIVLTPHQTIPERSLAAVIDNEICSLKHGIYNLGFLGVSQCQVAIDFSAWWSDRAYHFCRDDKCNGLFTDQRWIDLVPAFFTDVAIMRSVRHNVAPWNLTTRHITRGDNGEYAVNGEPLGFYHFTGYDSGAHRLMAMKNGGKNQALATLMNWYEDQTGGERLDPLKNIQWGYDCFSSGEKITSAQRLLYRERSDLQIAFPDPYDASGFLHWWKTTGKLELPDLHSESTREAAMSRLREHVTPGFRRDRQIDWAKVGGLFSNSLSNPAWGLSLGRRGWEILKTEGVSGIKRRLIS